jgi:hypothetical protein
MSYQPSHLTAATRQQPTQNPDQTEALLIDDDTDEFLDREILAIRESLTDFRSF